MKQIIYIMIIPFFSSCIFYSMAGSIPPHINSVSIPMVENQTVEFGISEAVTDNLVNQFLETIRRYLEFFFDEFQGQPSTPDSVFNDLRLNASV